MKVVHLIGNYESWIPNTQLFCTYHLRVTWYRACSLPNLRFSTKIIIYLGKLRDRPMVAIDR